MIILGEEKIQKQKKNKNKNQKEKKTRMVTVRPQHLLNGEKKIILPPSQPVSRRSLFIRLISHFFALFFFSGMKNILLPWQTE